MSELVHIANAIWVDDIIQQIKPISSSVFTLQCLAETPQIELSGTHAVDAQRLRLVIDVEVQEVMKELVWCFMRWRMVVASAQATILTKDGLTLLHVVSLQDFTLSKEVKEMANKRTLIMILICLIFSFCFLMQKLLKENDFYIFAQKIKKEPKDETLFYFDLENFEFHKKIQKVP